MTDPGQPGVDRVVGRLVQRVVAACNPREVVLFGSYAKGLADRNSDLDLLVVLDRPPSPAVAHAAFDATRAAIGVDIHVHAADHVMTAAADRYGFLAPIVREKSLLAGSWISWDLWS